jgi:hypothetical protein
MKKEFPIGWSAEETLLIQVDFDESNDRLLFTFSDAIVYKRVKTEDQLRQFLISLANDGPPMSDGTRPLDDARQHPLGVPVRGPANIVVLLNDRDWRYRGGGPPITAKQDKPGDNFGSWHVNADGDLLNNYQAGCKIACFLVARRAKGDIQRFNLHPVLLQNDGRWQEITIDPDVPEVGTEAFPPTALL